MTKSWRRVAWTQPSSGNMTHAEFSKRGGKARAKTLSAARRKAIARAAAKTRWNAQKARTPNAEVRDGGGEA